MSAIEPESRPGATPSPGPLPGEPSALPPVVAPPGAPPSVAMPLPLHPNFWWGLLWCFGMLMLTQVPAGGVALLLLFAIAFLAPDHLALADLGSLGALFSNPVMQAILGLALALAHVLLILLSLVVLRIVAGRDWARQIALRRPSLAHLGLVLALTPAFVVLGEATTQGLERIGVPSSKDLPLAAAYLEAVFAALLATGVVCLILRLILGRGWMGRLRPGTQLILSGLLIAGFVGQVALVYWLTSDWFRWLQVGNLAQGDTMGEMEKLFKTWPVALGVLIIAVLPGISEELWCRGFLGRGLVGKHGYLLGVVGTSFLFGLIHLEPRQATMAMVLGLVLHYVHLTTRSLLLPMLLHFLNNSLAVVLLRVESLGQLEKAPSGMLYAASGVLLVAVLVALYQSRARLVSPEGSLAWEPPYPGVASPPSEGATRIETTPVGRASLLGVLLGLVAFGLAVASIFRALP